MDRRVTYLTVRALEADGERFIEGWATTPSVDRMGDIVMPAGARFSLPMPLLWAHKHDEPIGLVVRAAVTKGGIRIRAKLTAGVARADEVWKLIRDGALQAVSVGFRALKMSPLPGGGQRFDEWEWHELSVVSVPANADAKIAVAKCVAYTEPGTPTRRITVSAARTAQPEKVDKAWQLEVDQRLRPGETQLQRHYRQYDACLGLLPPDLRMSVDLCASHVTKGIMNLIGTDGQSLAAVDLRTRSLRLASDPEPVPARKSAPAAHARKEYDQKLAKVVVAVAKRIRVVDKTISGVAQAIVELNERLEALEKGAE